MISTRIKFRNEKKFRYGIAAHFDHWIQRKTNLSNSQPINQKTHSISAAKASVKCSGKQPVFSVRIKTVCQRISRLLNGKADSTSFHYSVNM